MNNYQRAMTVIAEMKLGLWKPETRDTGEVYNLVYGNKNLWVANGGFFTDINGANYFGLFWRHLVWHMGAKQLRKLSKKKYKQGQKRKIDDQ